MEYKKLIIGIGIVMVMIGLVIAQETGGEGFDPETASPQEIADNFDSIGDLSSVDNFEGVQEAFKTKFGVDLTGLGGFAKLAGNILSTDTMSFSLENIDSGSLEVDKDGNIVYTPDEGTTELKLAGSDNVMIDTGGRVISLLTESGVPADAGGKFTFKENSLIVHKNSPVSVNGYEFDNSGDDLIIRFRGEGDGITILDTGIRAENVQDITLTTPTGIEIVFDRGPATAEIDYRFLDGTLLRSGMQNEKVSELAGLMNELGYVGANGRPLETQSMIYGPNTRQAVTDLQNDLDKEGLGLLPKYHSDGVFGGETISALNTAVGPEIRLISGDISITSDNIYTENGMIMGPTGQNPHEHGFQLITEQDNYRAYLQGFRDSDIIGGDITRDVVGVVDAREVITTNELGRFVGSKNQDVINYLMVTKGLNYDQAANYFNNIYGTGDSGFRALVQDKEGSFNHPNSPRPASTGQEQVPPLTESPRPAVAGTTEFKYNYVSPDGDYSEFANYLDTLTKTQGRKGVASQLGIEDYQDKFGQQMEQNIKSYKPLILEAAAKYDVPPEHIEAILIHESGGASNSVSTSRHECLGPMQLSRWLYKDSEDFGPAINPFDPEQAIDRGAAYYANYYHKYGMERALATYNGGPNLYSIPGPQRYSKEVQRIINSGSINKYD
ncbi:MAG: lytic transglycosylase domain-containing protein [Candidatus Woesearchaeota archaeon]